MKKIMSWINTICLTFTLTVVIPEATIFVGIWLAAHVLGLYMLYDYISNISWAIYLIAATVFFLKQYIKFLSGVIKD